MNEGVLVERINAQPEVRKMAETATDWEWRDEAQDLYKMAVLFKDRFLDGVLRIDRPRLPDPVISFDALKIKTLAAYTIHRNPQGLLDEITFNTMHYETVDGKKVFKFGEWSTYEILLHEQVHLWQQNFGNNPYIRGSCMHNREYVIKAESYGLHVAYGMGWHTDIADDPFADLMEGLGKPRPADVPKADNSKSDYFRLTPEKGKSTLTKWSCSCGEHVRVGSKNWPGAICKNCGTEYIQPLTNVLYEAP